MKRNLLVLVAILLCGCQQKAYRHKVVFYPPGQNMQIWETSGYVMTYPGHVEFTDDATGKTVWLYGTIKVESIP